jgi:hypothetical protein
MLRRIILKIVGAVAKSHCAIDPFGTVVVRLVGGPANGLVFVVPQRNLPKFVGIGYPVSRYQPQAGNGDVRIFRYVSVN